MKLPTKVFALLMTAGTALALGSFLGIVYQVAHNPEVWALGFVAGFFIDYLTWKLAFGKVDYR